MASVQMSGLPPRTGTATAPDAADIVVDVAGHDAGHDAGHGPLGVQARREHDVDHSAALGQVRLPHPNTSSDFSAPSWWQRHPQMVWAMLAAPPLLLLLVWFVYPLFGLLSRSLFAPGFTLRFYAQVFGSGAYLSLIWSTVRIALMTAMATALIGYPVAYWLSCLKGRRLQFCLALVLLPLWTSALVRNYAWILIMRRGGLLADVLGWVDIHIQPLLYSESGVLVGMVFTLLPYMVFSLYNAMRAIDARYPLAAASLGAPRWRSFVHVYLPLSMPGVTSGFLLVFIMSVGYFITPALLGGGRVQMISPEIDNQMNTLVDWNFGSALSVVLCAIVMVTVVAFVLLFDVEAFGMKKRGKRPTVAVGEETVPIDLAVASAAMSTAGTLRQTFAGEADAQTDAQTSGAGARRARRPVNPARFSRPPRRYGPIGLGVFGVLILAVLTAPVIIILGTSFTTTPYLVFPPKGLTFKWYAQLAHDPSWLNAAWLSVQVAAVSAVAAVVLGTLAAVALTRGTFFGKRIFNLLMIAPLIVPVIVVAVGVYFLFSQMGLLGTKWSFILVYTVMDLPLVLLIVSSALRRVDRTPELAATTLGASPLVAFMRTTMPMIWPALVAGGLFAFIHSFDDVVIAEFIAGVNTATLPKKMWVSLLYSIDPSLSAVSTLMVLVSTLALIAIGVVYRVAAQGKRAKA